MNACHLPAAPCVTARIDKLCDRFETAWKTGRRPSVAAYLRRVGEEDRTALLRELVLLDVEYRGRRGEHLGKDRYRRSLPEYIGVLDELWLEHALPEAGQSPPGWKAVHDDPAPSTVCLAAEPSRRPVVAERRARAVCPDSVSEERVGSLRRTWPFSELPAAAVRELAAAAEEKTYSPDERLIRQGEACRRLVLLVRGTVEVQVEEHGHRHTIATVRTAALFGEMSLLSGAMSTASVVATSAVLSLEIPAAEVERIAAGHPLIRSALGGLVADRLGGQSVDALVGKEVGGYHVLRCVGRGGMAVVYEAEHSETRRRVALKMMSHRYIHDLELHSRFQREAEIGKKLRHRNICRVRGTFTALGTNFMVLDFCEGMTLDERIRRGRLPEDEVRRILGQLAAALEYAHRKGVCHRDLKPSNVMLDGSGRVKLMDFGLARIMDAPEFTCRGRLLGTPRYMPPEQLAGEPVDFRADLFAFGCVAYEMLTGRPLFPEASYLSIVERHAQWSLPAPQLIRRGLGRDLYEVLRDSLAKEPDRRVLDLERVSRQWMRKPDRKTSGCVSLASRV
ncbi:MAG: protein kinase [Pirellulales bacterium]|nr:protein kinase [Pirellulales bacterium]